MNNNGAIYSISAVAKMLGVPVATLRTWEDRYAQVVPERTPSRHRLFTRDQVEQLKFVKSQIDSGASAADAHRLLNARTTSEAPVEKPRPRRRNNRLILLAENDRFAVEFQEYFLRAEGFETRAALDYDSALEAATSEDPTLVVVELLISGGLGLDLCRDLKSKENPPRVLAVSSLDSREQALKACADAFLAKPLDPVLFMSTVNELVGSGAWAGQSAAM
ncbi:MAG TPA: MerR family transcriptional regulator [Actinomycetota bacterium]|nr:MerR family transcriptional regulator [Actinomycetota bacterium]